MRMKVVFVSMFAAVFISCQRGSTDTTPTIALVVKTLNHPFFIDMENGARDAADRLGVRFLTHGPEREVDVEKQMQIVENLIQRKVDALCIAPCGSKEIVPAVVKANRAGIPVLVVDTRVDEGALRESGGYVVTFIGSDNFEGGRIAGKYIVQRLGGKGRVAVLEGIPGHETGDVRRRGFQQALASEPGMEIVASQTANWERDQGFNVFQNILQAHPDVEALFACNDLMALGAVEAIETSGKTGEILVVGFDALEDAKEAILGGRMEGSVAQHPYNMGKLAVENAYRVINGESINSYVPVEIEFITKEKLE